MVYIVQMVYEGFTTLRAPLGSSNAKYHVCWDLSLGPLFSDPPLPSCLRSFSLSWRGRWRLTVALRDTTQTRKSKVGFSTTAAAESCDCLSVAKARIVFRMLEQSRASLRGRLGRKTRRACSWRKADRDSKGWKGGRCSVQDGSALLPQQN